MINANTSAANVALVQSLYAAFGSGELIPALNAAADPAIVWELFGRPEEFPVGGRKFHGVAGIQEFFQTLAGISDFVEFTPQEFIASDNRVAALGHYAIKMKKNGRTVSCNWAHVYDIRDGKVTSFREYTDTAQFANAYRG